MRRCRLPNGKIMWLCNEHQLSTGSSIISGTDALTVKQTNFDEKLSEIHDHSENSIANTVDMLSKTGTQLEIPVVYKPTPSSLLNSNHASQLTEANSEDSIDENDNETIQEEQNHSAKVPSTSTAVLNSAAPLAVTNVGAKPSVVNLSASKPEIQSRKAENSNDVKVSTKQVNSSIDHVKNNANMPKNELIKGNSGKEF